MLTTVVRALLLTICASTLVVGVAASPAQAKEVPKAITDAAKTVKCKGLEKYDADKPTKFAVECHLKGKGKNLGYSMDGRTDMLLYKTKSAGKAFWKDRLTGCGECYIVNKGKLWIAGAGYTKDIAEYVHRKLGGKLYFY